MTRKSLPRHKLLPIHKLLPRHKLLPPHKYSKIPDTTQTSPIRNRQAGCAIPPFQILYAPCRLSSSITSGAKPPSHTLLPPQVSHQAQIRPSVHFSLLKCHIRKMPTCPSPQAVPSRTVSLRSTGLRLSQDFSTPVSFADSPFQGHTAFVTLWPVAPLLRFSLKTSLTLHHDR